MECQRTHFAIDLATVSFLPIGDDPNAFVFWGDTPDCVSHFIKLRAGQSIRPLCGYLVF